MFRHPRQVAQIKDDGSKKYLGIWKGGGFYDLVTDARRVAYATPDKPTLLIEAPGFLGEA